MAGPGQCDRGRPFRHWCAERVSAGPFLPNCRRLVTAGGTQAQMIPQCRAFVGGAVDPALLQLRDEQFDDVVEAVGDEVRRDVESVHRTVPDEVDELVGQAGGRSDVAAGAAAELDHRLAQRPSIRLGLLPPRRDGRPVVRIAGRAEGAAVVRLGRVIRRERPVGVVVAQVEVPQQPGQRQRGPRGDLLTADPPGLLVGLVPRWRR